MSLLTDLVAYWKMDEASGNAIDSHGANDLTDNNTVGSATGKISNARDFELANSEYFSIAHNTDLTTGDIDFTWSVWVQLESKGFSGAGWILGKYDDGISNFREYEIDYLVSSDRFRFTVRHSGGGAETTISANNLGSPSTATWYHIVAYHDSVNNQLGIIVNDGTPDTMSFSSGVQSSSGAEFRIGSVQNPDPGRSWDGLIDEVGFWKRVLTAQEITDLYNGGSGLSYDNFGGVTAGYFSRLGFWQPWGVGAVSGGPFPHFIRRSNVLSGGMFGGGGI